MANRTYDEKDSIKCPNLSPIFVRQTKFCEAVKRGEGALQRLFEQAWWCLHKTPPPTLPSSVETRKTGEGGATWGHVRALQGTHKGDDIHWG